MGDSVDRFVERAPGLLSATLVEDDEYVQVYRGQLDDRDGEHRIPGLAADSNRHRNQV